MNLISAFCLIATATSLAHASEEIKVDDGVLVLTKANFKEAVTDNEFLLVEFCKYASLRKVQPVRRLPAFAVNKRKNRNSIQ
jgi:hypothetical protein